MELFNLAGRIKKALKRELPAYDAHKLMGVSGHYRKQQPPDNCCKAAVLALFFPIKNNWKLVFIRRSNRYVQDRHKGQIGFPGGKFESGDKTLLTTALRETNEEIGVEANKIEILGQLSKLYIPVSNFLVQPFVGILDFEPEFRLQTQEVEELILSDFNTFLQKRVIHKTNIQIEKGIHLTNVPYYDLNGEILWGATAMILTELLHVLDKDKK